MSKFPGGIFSKARGKVGGLVFSAARAREGKVMTVRELVIPANPRTPLQQGNRMIFQFVQGAVRTVGRDVYHNDWNRGVSDLPGYQSLLSLIRRSYRQSSSHLYVAEAPPPNTLLGELHRPETFSASRPSNFQRTFSWSTETGENGSASDQVVMLGFRYFIDSDEAGWWAFTDTSAVRSDGELTVTLPLGGSGNQLLYAFYFRNRANEVPNVLSEAVWGYI